MSEYVLYGWRQTGSMAIEAALAETGVVHRFVPVSRATNENRTDAFARINPRKQLPVLQLPDGTIVTEGPAILNHIADAHPQTRLAPAPGSSARARHDRWLAFFHANVYEAMLRELAPTRYTTDPAGAPGIKDAATAYVQRHFAMFENELSDGPYLAGEAFSMFDIYLWMLAHWVEVEWLAAQCPRIRRLCDAASARPHLAPVLARHFG